MNRYAWAMVVGTIGCTQALGQVCDFEDPDDPFCESLGMVWTNQGGQPTLTGQVNHTPGGARALYNNFNAPIGYEGPVIESLWITSWAGFPATTVEFVGGPTVTLTPGVWQQVSLGMASFIMRPSFNGQSNFGTFAIDDINIIPAPSSLALLGLIGLGLRRRRGT